MRNGFLAATALVAVLGLAAQGASATVVARPTMPAATDTPLAVGTIDGISFQAPAGIFLDSPGDVFFGDPSGVSIPVLFGDSTNGAVLTSLSGGGTVDPFLSFSLAVTDLGTPSSFAFAFSIPLSPTLSGPVSVHSTLGVTLTSPPNGSGSIAPTSGFIMLSNVGTCAAGVDIGNGFVAPANTSTTQSFDGLGTFTPSPGCDSSITAFIGFNGSGNGEQYGLTGSFDVEPIPEPLSLTLFGSAVLGTLGVARRRRG